MNETLKILETRRSCRNFLPDMVEEEKLQAVLRAGQYAPTGMGKQSPIIIAITDKETREEIAKINASVMGVNYSGMGEKGDPFYGAPVVFVVLANKAIGTYKYDGSLVMGNMLNAAASLGLGSIWIHRAKEEFESEYGKELLKKLGIEGDYEGIGNCALGYAAAPADPPAPRKDNYVYRV